MTCESCLADPLRFASGIDFPCPVSRLARWSLALMRLAARPLSLSGPFDVVLELVFPWFGFVRPSGGSLRWSAVPPGGRWWYPRSLSGPVFGSACEVCWSDVPRGGSRPLTGEVVSLCPVAIFHCCLAHVVSLAVVRCVCPGFRGCLSSGSRRPLPWRRLCQCRVADPSGISSCVRWCTSCPSSGPFLL